MQSIVLLFSLALLGVMNYATLWDFPKLPPPSQYGNILINRISGKNGQLPVTFSHWIHRIKYTCRVCHSELDFAMEVNKTEITMKKNREGEYCGACHNGKTAFGFTKENCPKCHNGDIAYGSEKFEEFRRHMPKSRYGNKINWSKAIGKKRIKPKSSIRDDDYSPIPFKKMLVLKSEWSLTADAFAVFSHKRHIRWLDCADCHPDIFNIKKKGTKFFRMKYILDRKFCGVCHMNVAFPVQDCIRCHPALGRNE
ncbi:class III cytochrome C family protein [bacterium BMS3Abin07]|nr:class III cytochrome C family protein [bacterium BMS3Abin07]GBE33286.1 class III cytochrome C family protein [bacterium BMS3Bbin05]